jgi:predicted amidohydrolase YtcJ
VDEIGAGLVLVNGRILTFDPGRPRATALAVTGGRIAAVGAARDVRRTRDRRTEVIDLRGATVIPGLVDAHAHLDREGLKSLYPSLARCRSIGDVQAVVRRQVARVPKGQWIVTMPVGSPPFYQDAPSGLAERRWPTRADLDVAAPDHPVYIRGIWGYWNRPPVYSIANSRALARAGVTRDTEPPPGVEIVKDAAGEPTGVFVEHNAIQVLEFTLLRDAPRFSHADRLRALVASQKAYAARGVTAVYEGHGIAPEVLAVYREVHARGALRLRASLAVSPTWSGADAARALADAAGWAGDHGLGDDRLRVAGICLHYGGDARVAEILHAAQPYTGWAGFVESANTCEAYASQATLAASLGLRVNTLVTRCLPEVLDVWEEVAARHPIRERRWVLVHLNAATPAQLARIRRLGAVATTNPISYLYRSAGDEVAKLEGDAERLLPHRSLLQSRIPFGIATDNKPADPWVAFAAIVARRDMRTGVVVGPGQRLSRAQALAALTRGGAWVTFSERERGRLAPGWAADLAVLEHDPLSAPLEALVGQTARLTVVGGQIVHRA